MENLNSSVPADQRSRFRATNCTCSFCLRLFSLSDPSVRDLFSFLRHLQERHGLKLGEPVR